MDYLINSFTFIFLALGLASSVQVYCFFVFVLDLSPTPGTSYNQLSFNKIPITTNYVSEE